MSWWSETCMERPQLWTRYDTEDEEAFTGILETGEVVKDNAVRTVRRMKEGILKEYRGSRALFKVGRERRNLEEGRRLGLPVPEPYWEFMHFRTPFLLMEDLGDHPTLFDVSRSDDMDRTLVESLGDLCRDCLDAGLAHRDFHAGNVIVRNGTLHLVDLDAVTFQPGPLLDSEARSLLTGMLSSLEPLSDEAHLCWLGRALPDLNAGQLGELLMDLKRRRARVWERHFSSRARKALRDSGSWVSEDGAARRIRRRELDADEVSRVLDRVPAAPFLKEDTKTRLWRDTIGDRPVVVKEFREAQPWRRRFGLNRSRRCWWNTVQLEARGISAPKPLAYQEHGDGRGLVVMSDIVGSWGLDRFLDDGWKNMHDDVRHEEAACLVSLLKNLMDRGAWPADLKACNILRVAGNYVLVDLDGMSFGEPPDDAALLRSLVQLHLSIPTAVDFRWRARFVRMLVGDRLRARRLILRVARMTKGISSLWQGADGDDREGVL